MILELHVWGPAFGLPSIDAQCLVAIAYFSLGLDRDQWALVASSDAGWSPTSELPALRDEDVIIGGLPSIIDHLRQKSDGALDLDQQFQSSKERADIIAFSSHILTHLHPLLSLSLFVSSENYTTTTRPAYTSILPWPTQFYIPPSHRQAAKIRTEHLNLSSLDLDNIDDDERQRRRLADVVPERLRRTATQSVTGLVNAKKTGTRFRCDALVDVACAPLQQLLGDKKYLLSDDSPSSLDCLALAYLALALKPDVPQKWLQEGIKGRYPKLCEYVERGIQEGFGDEVGVKDARLNETIDGTIEIQTKLPWRAPSQSGLQAAGSTIAHSILSAILSTTSTIASVDKSEKAGSSEATPISLLLPTITAVGTAVAAAAGYFLYSSMGAEPEKRRLQDMGEAGALFAGLHFGDDDRRENVNAT